MTTPPQGPATPPPAAPLPPRPALARSVDVLVSLGALAAIAYCAVATFWPGLLPAEWLDVLMLKSYSLCLGWVLVVLALSWRGWVRRVGGARPLGRLRKLALVGLPVAGAGLVGALAGISDSGLYHAFVVLIFLVVAAGGVANLLDALAPGAPWGLPWPARPPDAWGWGCLYRSARVAVLVAVLLGTGLATYAGYRSTHDLPNPWWATFSKAFRYTPEQGPPSPVFFDTRPEAAVEAYVADYLRVAGTFPCAADLHSIADSDQFAYFTANDDPVLTGTGHCAVHRPVARVEVPAVYVGKIFSDEGGLGAQVDVRVTYADGERWAGQIGLDPQDGQAYAGLFGRYYGAVIHETCWLNEDWSPFYPNVVARVPHGIAYYPPVPSGDLQDPETPLCQR